jgi:hypothetical protein
MTRSVSLPVRFAQKLATADQPQRGQLPRGIEGILGCDTIGRGALVRSHLLIERVVGELGRHSVANLLDKVALRIVSIGVAPVRCQIPRCIVAKHGARIDPVVF